MALPLTFTPVVTGLAPISIAPAPMITTDQTQVAAWVRAQEPQVQSLLARVHTRSQGEFFYPDGRSPCDCGASADDLSRLKTWDGDPVWCMRKDGPLTAPVVREPISCGELPTLFWPEIFAEAQTLLRGYLARPPAQSADSVTQAMWTERVFQLCTVMGTATNVSPALFAAFMSNPVGPNFVPRVKLQLRDTFIDAYDMLGADLHRRARVWLTEPVPGQSVSQAMVDMATGGGPPPLTPTTATLPGLPAQVAAMWNAPVPAGSSPDTWFGGRVPQDRTVVVSDPFNLTGRFPSVHVQAQANDWFDDALTPAYFKGGGMGGGALPEWACQNSRTKAWMLGDMDPFRAGSGFIRDGVLAWPSEMMAGADPHAFIQAMRGDPTHGTFSQLEALFRAMGGAWSKPGWIWYNEWYEGSNAAASIAGIGRTLYQREQLGQGYVPGAWFYMSAAYRWGAWFSGLDYATIVNSSLYWYVSNYLPYLVSRYSELGVTIATPSAVQQLQTQVTSVFASVARQQSATIGAVTSTIAAIAAAVAGTGVGIVFGIVLAVVAELSRVVTTGMQDEAAANNIIVIHSPMIRVPVDPNCHLDVSGGAADLAATVPGYAAPAANAMIAAYVASLAQPAHQDIARMQAPAPMSTTAKVAIGVGAVALIGALVLALRKR